MEHRRPEQKPPPHIHLPRRRGGEAREGEGGGGGQVTHISSTHAKQRQVGGPCHVGRHPFSKA